MRCFKSVFCKGVEGSSQSLYLRCLMNSYKELHISLRTCPEMDLIGQRWSIFCTVFCIAQFVLILNLLWSLKKTCWCIILAVIVSFLGIH